MNVGKTLEYFKARDNTLQTILDPEYFPIDLEIETWSNRVIIVFPYKEA